MVNLYVFGIRQPQHPDYAPAYYACLCRQAVATVEEADRMAATYRAAGKQAFVHTGLTAGRDALPVDPAADLQAALEQAEWTEAHYATEADRQTDRAKGIAC